ncbi:MAG: universal stress protein [Pseudomonadota bacterium]
MLVKYWMRKAVITIDVGDSMQEAVSKMKEYFVPLLPVMKRGQLVGVITDRDLKRASASDATSLDVCELAYLLSKIKAGDIMSKPVTTVPDNLTLEETAEILLSNNISGAPVLDPEGRIVGTISQRDIFRALISVTGLKKRGIQFAFRIEDRPGSIKEVTDVIRDYGGRLVSILTSYDGAPEGTRYLFVRAYRIDRDNVGKLKEALTERTTMIYFVDHRDNVREEFHEFPPTPAVGAGTPGVVAAAERSWKILFCEDFSEDSTRARHYALEYAKALNAELVIVHVFSSQLAAYPAFQSALPTDMSKMEAKVKAGAEAELQKAADECGKELSKVKAVMKVGTPASEIVRLASEEGVDLIVTGTHGWTGIRHLILGSVAENVVRMAECPVLTVRGEPKKL